MHEPTEGNEVDQDSSRCEIRQGLFEKLFFFTPTTRIIIVRWIEKQQRKRVMRAAHPEHISLQRTRQHFFRDLHTLAVEFYTHGHQRWGERSTHEVQRTTHP